MSVSIVHTSDGNFARDVLESDRPVLVDFWADWCGPCRAIAPVIDQIAEEYGERVKVAKIDIDKNQRTPVQFGVRGIPMLILFKDGAAHAQHVGVLSKSQLAAFLEANL